MKKLGARRIKPRELLILAGIIAVFAGLITLMASRELVLALVVLGVAFIVTLVTFATLQLSVADDESSGEGVISQARLIDGPDIPEKREDSGLEDSDAGDSPRADPESGPTHP